MRPGDDLVRLSVGGGESITCDAPTATSRDADTLSFEYDLRPRAPVVVRTDISLVDALDGVALRRNVSVEPAPSANGVAVCVGDVVGIPRGTIFVPHQDRFGEEAPPSARRFVSLGRDGERIAVSMIGEIDATGQRVTRVTDETLATTFESNRIDWAYDLPLATTESRVALPPEDHPRFMFMLHGFFGEYGKYAQDSSSQPGAWHLGLFPNLRNTFWSCNWSDHTHLDDTVYGTPVATSNGFIDNIGIARLDRASCDRLFELFAKRKNARRQELRWLTAP